MPKSQEKEDSGFKDIESKIDQTLLNVRRIYISDAITSESSQEVVRRLWYLELQDPGKPILLVISSPGGSIDAGFAIWDTVKMLKSPVYTLVTGLAASMGSVLSLCATKGHRFATQNARIMIHQPRLGGGIRGQASDLEIQAEEITKTRKQLVALYSEQTGKDFDTIDKALDRDMWMTAEEAKEFGLIDKLVGSFDEIPVS